VSVTEFARFGYDHVRVTPPAAHPVVCRWSAAALAGVRRVAAVGPRARETPCMACLRRWALRSEGRARARRMG